MHLTRTSASLHKLARLTPPCPHACWGAGSPASGRNVGALRCSCPVSASPSWHSCSRLHVPVQLVFCDIPAAPLGFVSSTVLNQASTPFTAFRPEEPPRRSPVPVCLHRPALPCHRECRSPGPSPSGCTSLDCHSALRRVSLLVLRLRGGLLEDLERKQKSAVHSGPPLPQCCLGEKNVETKKEQTTEIKYTSQHA